MSSHLCLNNDWPNLCINIYTWKQPYCSSYWGYKKQPLPIHIILHACYVFYGGHFISESQLILYFRSGQHYIFNKYESMYLTLKRCGQSITNIESIMFVLHPLLPGGLIMTMLTAKASMNVTMDIHTPYANDSSQIVYEGSETFTRHSSTRLIMAFWK